MPSLQDNIAAIKRAEIAKRATIEAELLLKVDAASAGEALAAKARDEHKGKLAAVVAEPLDSLADDDKVIDARLRAERVAEVRLATAEKALADAQAALAAAKAELKADADVQLPAFDKAARAREQTIKDFDGAFPMHARGLFDLISVTLEIEALALEAGGKRQAPHDSRRPTPEFERGSPNFASLRIELVDASGAVLWRGNQFSNSSADPQAQ